jgi:hypothetical protein
MHMQDFISTKSVTILSYDIGKEMLIFKIFINI